MTPNNMPINVPMIDEDDWVVLRISKYYVLYLGHSGMFQRNLRDEYGKGETIKDAANKIDIECRAPDFSEFLKRFLPI